ncbi:MAG: hypothetical protein IJJ82_00225 [Clostridia bacterium]|nr:hypothetical protein [Clostridia bacterium]
MQKKKENFLDRVIKKNFNNELEHVLEHKEFDEDAKSLLLSILYKLETAYSDYTQVKKNVMPKEEFLQMIIDIIQKDVDKINLVKIGSEEANILENRTFIVDKKNKEITCYPIERKLLYALLKISKKDKIIKDKYYVINRTISDMLNTGNNINMVEPMRDFNGFSWSVVIKDIESVEHNLIYQNLRIIAGAEFLNKWIYNRESIIDYFELLKEKLEKLYGKQKQEELIDAISKLSVLLEVKYDKEKTKKFLNGKKEIENRIKEISDKEEFTVKLTKEKKELNKQIKNLDTLISDKALLQEEYKKRNAKLPLEKKIFSMRVLANMLKEERQKLENRRENINKMLNPQKFIKYKNELEEKYKYIQYIEATNVEKKITAELLNFQNEFLECYKIKIEKAKTKEELLNNIIELRYYLNIPLTRENKIFELNQLASKIQEITQNLVNKGIQEKVLVNISNQKGLNYYILKEIFKTKIINLESVNIELTKENERLYLQIFDENIFDEKVDLGDIKQFDPKQFNIKLNKTIKVFNI